MKNKFPVLKPHLLLMGMAISACTFAQQPGDLDLNFGTDGIVTYDVIGQDDYINKVLIQNDGKILCMGRTQASWQNDDVLMARFLPTGELDPTFGQNGVVITAISSNNDVGNDMVIQDDGKVLVAGYTTLSNDFDLLLLRYKPDGGIDSAFGNNGVLVMDVEEENNILQSIELLSDGRILGFGRVGNDLALFQYLSAGIVDNTFGNGGVAVTDLGFDQQIPTDLLVLENGTVLVSASVGPGQEMNAIVCRFTDDGNLDDGFNTIGWVSLSVNPSFVNLARNVAVTSDGKIIVSGSSYNGASESEVFAARLQSDGQVDASFGNGGIVLIDVGLGYDFADALVLQPDQKILLAGYTNDGTISNFDILRIDAAGTLDLAFGNNGVVITEVSVGDNGVNSMALQPDGKLVVAGSARMGTNDDIALARYHTGLNLSVNDRDEKPLFSVYPSPATETLNVRSEAKLQTIELIDALGKKVLTVRPNSNRSQLDIAMLPSGIYLLRATDGQRLYTQKVVKE